MVSGPKKYEIAYILTPSLTNEEALIISGKLSTLVEEAQGTVRHREDPRKRRLAYHVKKQDYGYFGWITFDAAPDILSEIEKKLKTMKEVMRHLMVVGEEVPPQPLRTFTPRPESPKVSPRPVSPESVPVTEKKLDLEELDKRLEEILGK